MRDIKPIIGYVHTGIEKTAEDKSYWKVIPVVERMDYLSYYFNAMAFCGAVETLLGVEVPPRAQYLRVIHLELNRIMSHLVWLGTERARPRRDLDVLVLLPRARDDPRPVRDVLRPADAHALLPGRRRDRGHPAAASRRSCASSSTRCRPAPTSTPTCWRRTRSCSSACTVSCPLDEADAAGARRHRPAAARGRQPVGPAQGRPVLELRPLRVQDPGRHGRRQLRPLPGPPRRALRVGEDHRARRSTGCPRVRSSPPTARSRCRRATSWRPGWRR